MPKKKAIAKPVLNEVQLCFVEQKYKTMSAEELAGKLEVAVDVVNSAIQVIKGGIYTPKDRPEDLHGHRGGATIATKAATELADAHKKSVNRPKMDGCTYRLFK